MFSLHKNMDKSIQGHRQRLRQRFAKHGFEDFHDYEVLELLLTYAIPRVDVKPIAKRLLNLGRKNAGSVGRSIGEILFGSGRKSG